MKQKEIENIKTWLTEHGYIYKTYDGMSDCVMVNTNYDGPHPKAKTFKSHYDIQRYISRFHAAYKTEERGHWTGLFISRR